MVRLYGSCYVSTYIAVLRLHALILIAQLLEIYTWKPLCAVSFMPRKSMFICPTHSACNNGTACSSGKVAGLIFFETFSYLWTSQVIGNVTLATLAGGPYGGEVDIHRL